MDGILISWDEPKALITPGTFYFFEREETLRCYLEKGFHAGTNSNCIFKACCGVLGLHIGKLAFSDFSANTESWTQTQMHTYLPPLPQGKLCSHRTQRKCSQPSGVTSWFVEGPTNLDT